MLSKITSLMKHQGFLRYFKNTSWMMAEQGLRLISGLFVGIWVARYLGPEQFGIFSYALAFTAIFAGIAKLGLDGIMVRELINQPQQRDMYMGTAFWLKMAGACLVMALIAAILPFTTNDATTKLYIFIITAGLVFQSFEVVDFYFQAQVMAKVVSLCKVIQLTLSSMVRIYLVLSGADLVWFVLVTAFDTLTLAVCYVAAYKFNQRTAFYSFFSLPIAKRLLKDSWPLIFSAIVVMVYMRIDQIMINNMLGDYEVGVYSAAVRLSEIFYFIPILLSASLFPAILNAKQHSAILFQQRLQRLYTFMVWLSIFIAIVMTISADFLIEKLFGNAYQDAAQVLVIHVWSAVFVFLGVSFSKYLLSENLTKIDFQRTLLGALCNVSFNLFLIPNYGLSGAALATLLSQFVVNIFYDIFDKRLHGQLVMKLKAFLMPWKIYTS